MSPGAATWARLAAALQLLCVDPGGLGGLWLRARAGPLRDRATDAAAALPLPPRRLHPAIGDEALFGGLDLAATLAEGRMVRRAGVLAAPALLVLPMAERATPGLAARLAAALDAGPGHCLIALDEGAADDEALSPALAERLAFHIDLEGLAWGDTGPIELADAAAARARLGAVALAPGALADLVRVAHALGVESLRAPLLAARAARAAAALAGRAAPGPEELRRAVELVLAPRATRLPEPEAGPEDPAEDKAPPPGEPGAGEEGAAGAPSALPAELLLEAARALLPADLLARVAAGRAARGAKAGAGAGAPRKGNRRGRPLPARPGRPDGQARIDLVATLRAAAPWQPLRRAEAGGAPRLVHLRPADIRLRRFEERSDRLLIFTVDASGSAAFARLAEAKGAVELLLAEAYARRDHVALVAFRGQGAEVLLPPTRSLVQTKRRLAGLPGGGGTPLAAGLRAAMGLAEAARGRGLSPAIALLTDGRANIALDGRADRAAAAADAQAVARALRAAATPALVIDTGTRPEPGLRALAETLGGPYLALPRAESGRIVSAVAAALGG